MGKRQWLQSVRDIYEKITTERGTTLLYRKALHGHVYFCDFDSIPIQRLGSGQQVLSLITNWETFTWKDDVLNCGRNMDVGNAGNGLAVMMGFGIGLSWKSSPSQKSDLQALGSWTPLLHFKGGFPFLFSDGNGISIAGAFVKKFIGSSPFACSNFSTWVCALGCDGCVADYVYIITLRLESNPKMFCCQMYHRKQ